MQKTNDFNNMNITELDAVIKEVKLALKWGLKDKCIQIQPQFSDQLWLLTEMSIRTKGITNPSKEVIENPVRTCDGIWPECFFFHRVKQNKGINM